MKRVLLIQKYITNYRVPVFEKISQSTDWKWYFAAGDHPGGSASGTGAGSTGINEIDISTYSAGVFGRKVYFQTGIVSTILRLRPHIVILDMSWPILTNIILLFICKLANIPIIGWAKGINEKGNGFLEPYKSWFLKQLDAIVAYGSSSKEALNKKNISTDVYVAQNTVRTTQIIDNKKYKDDRKLEDKKFVVGYMGSILRKKGVKKIVDSFYEMTHEKKCCHLRIAGKGPMYNDIKEHVKKLGIESQATFDGYFKDEEKKDILNSFDIFVSPQHEGLSVIEAMASGLCVVVGTNRRPETELIVHNMNGIVVGECDVGLTQIFESLYENRSNVRKLGLNARRTIKKNAKIGDMVHGFESAVEAVLSN